MDCAAMRKPCGETRSMTIWIQALACVSLVSALSLTGLVALTVSESVLRRALFLMVSLAVGALLGDAFVHLIPESFRHLGFGPQVPLLILSGLGAFFVLEKFLHWRQGNTLEGHVHVHPVGPMNLVANGVHNFIDGVLIGAAFLSHPGLGVATTVAIVLHEIPQEIGNFAVLVHAGYARSRALFFNFLSGCTAVAGTLLALLIGNAAAAFSIWILPVAAGGFIY
ncbi:MAG: ZIP family metal transporter, partial [Cytophagaceae bacterium]